MEKPFIIGITGGSGSGKTSFIKQLRNAFSPQELCIVSQDDYYRPREEQALDEQGIRNFDLPHSIDQEAFINDVHRLIRRQVVTRTEYTFNNEKKEPGTLTFYPAPILLLEGIFVFYKQEIHDMLDLTIFLHAKENLKIVRRILRDQAERNYPLEDVLYRYINHVTPTFERYIQPYREKADIVINNNENFDAGLEVIKCLIQQKITAKV
jgi:uridine kinase